MILYIFYLLGEPAFPFCGLTDGPRAGIASLLPYPDDIPSMMREGMTQRTVQTAGVSGIEAGLLIA